MPSDKHTHSIVWANFFANLVAMQRHPGNVKDGTKIIELGVLADAMLEEWKKRWSE